MSVPQELSHAVEKLAEALVSADPTTETIGEIQGYLEDILWETSEFPQISDLIESNIKLCVESKDDDIQDLLKKISETVSTLQTQLERGDDSVDSKDLNTTEKDSPKTESKQREMPELPAFADETMFTDFLQRQTDCLERVEELLMILEKGEDSEKRSELKRLIHTLKGEAGLLNLTDIESLCHAAEDSLGKPCSSKLIDCLFKVKDWLGNILGGYSGKESSPQQSMDEILENLKNLQAENQNENLDSPKEAQEKEKEEESENHLKEEPSEKIFKEEDLEMIQDFIPEALEHVENAEVHLLTLETDPDDSDAINATFRAFHTIKGTAGFLSLRDIQKLAHKSEDLLDQGRKGKIKLVGPAIDVILEAVDALKQLIQSLREAAENGEPLISDPNLSGLLERIQAITSGEIKESSPPPQVESEKLGDILVETGATSQESVNQALIKQQEEGGQLGEQLIKAKEVSAKEVTQALRSQKQSKIKVKEAIKVDADRLDHLVDMIGELVIAEAMINTIISEDVLKVSSRLKQQSIHINKIVRELQEIGTSLRMIPIRPVFQKMARLVRDLSKKMEKPVHFTTLGEETMLDKTVVDQIGDPLIHMVRNSIDHGLEDNQEVRKQAGKPEVGQVALRAFHHGGSIHIEIEDDGRGLNQEAILEKAKKNNLISENDQLSDREIFNLIFEPGFSTAKAITNVSGRGVGMDVVKRTIESLRGQVEIKSAVGEGTKFIIRLPLTMAIIDGMLIRVGAERFIVPTLAVVRSVFTDECEHLTIHEYDGTCYLQGETIPLVRLSKIFNVTLQGKFSEGVVMVIENEGKQVGLLIDEIIGQQQIVIKPLGKGLESLNGISGGAIMPDGQVGLIIDVTGVIQLAHTQEKNKFERMEIA